MNHENHTSKVPMPKDAHMAAMKHINEKGCDGLHKVMPMGKTADAEASKGKGK